MERPDEKATMSEMVKDKPILVPASGLISPAFADHILRSIRLNGPVLEAMGVFGPGVRHLELKLDENLGLTVPGMPSRHMFDKMSEAEIAAAKEKGWAPAEARKSSTGEIRGTDKMLIELMGLLLPHLGTLHVGYQMLHSYVSVLLTHGEGELWSALSVYCTVYSCHEQAKADIRTLREFPSAGVVPGQKPLKAWLPQLAARMSGLGNARHYKRPGEAWAGQGQLSRHCPLWAGMASIALRLAKESKVGRAGAASDLADVLAKMANLAQSHGYIYAMEEKVNEFWRHAHPENTSSNSESASESDGLGDDDME